MNKIIKFPIAVQQLNATPPDPVLIDGMPLLKSWEFTCIKCKNVSSFSSTNMVFRTFEFYCVECGSLHKVNNPAFSNKK